jgi:hypothetical protein
VAARFGSPYNVVKASAKVWKEANSVGGVESVSLVSQLFAKSRNQLKAGPVRRAPAYNTFDLSVWNWEG